ncbi:hypothetical protein CY34DRAFT_25787 [Suillus luteus UH-Slu-Lm8-n1]|uniref:Uncharacterized protein n=1 Tax=Suillus luteus UH-Slu-Lm8-n1 TaxID=930992 RepID=A0A0D0B2A8_9AGAM|nr:hypothetical protein CY34DRAFT_25787 [Suillus luteus UH-Slu-Lm8-n1]
MLHQLYQGLIKHLLGWLSAACGGAEIDARCCRLPPNHHIHLFSKGIICLSCISKTKHTQICHFHLGICLPNNLNLLNDTLDLFHKNKDIFIDLSIHSNFNLSKLYAARHYSAMIMMFGTMDNYNTEYTERLHIDFMKDTYHTTNHKDKFVQIMQWLKCEKIMRHDKYVNWRYACASEEVSGLTCTNEMSQPDKHLMSSTSI